MIFPFLIITSYCSVWAATICCDKLTTRKSVSTTVDVRDLTSLDKAGMESLQVIVGTYQTEIVRTLRKIGEDGFMPRADYQKDPISRRFRDAIDIGKNTKVAFIPIRDQIGASIRSIGVIGQEHIHVRRMVGAAGLI